MRSKDILFFFFFLHALGTVAFTLGI